MQLRFWIFLITLLLPTSAFANSCKSFLKNKTYKPYTPVSTLSMAIGTHKPTKETIWKTCYEASLGRTTKYSEDFYLGNNTIIVCDGKNFSFSFDEFSEPGGFSMFEPVKFSLKNWFNKSSKYPIKIKDKQDIYWPLSFKGKWNKRFCNKLDLDNLSSLEKVLRQRRGDTNVNEYIDTRIIFGKYYRKDAGGKILFRREIFSTFKTYEPIF